MTNDRINQIIEQRIAGRSVRAIAKMLGTSVAEVNKAIDFWAETAIDDKLRKTTLCLELARLDQMQEVFHARALQGDVQCGALVTKIIERRCTMLGLHAPQTATLQIVENAEPKQTSTDKIEAVLARLIQDGKKDDSVH
jgi:transposase